MPQESYIIAKLFYDLDRDTVVSLRDSSVALIAEGKTLMSWTSAGQNFQKEWTGLTPAQVLAEANAALRHMDGTRVYRTFTNFSGSWK